MRTYSKSLYSSAQRKWCKNYERVTTFEPLMCDYEAGNQTFLQAARFSVDWFAGWSSDAHLTVGDNIPGAYEYWMSEVALPAPSRDFEPMGRTTSGAIGMP